MEIRLVPDPGADDAVTRAVVAALNQPRRAAGESGFRWGKAWQRAGLEEAVERDAPSNGNAVGPLPRGAMTRGYVPSVRSSRGATRA